MPARLLPPARDPEVFHAFTYRVTFCNHAQLAALESFVLSLPRAGGEPAPPAPCAPAAAPPGADQFPGIFDGLMRNRGLGVRNMPFTGLSMSTIYGMVRGQLFQAAVEADRLSGRDDHGVWKPWNSSPDPCPDDAAPGRSG